MRMIVIILTIVASSSLAQSKADPRDWILWRAAPIAFPDSISPPVPELMRGEVPVDFQKDGSDLTIVMPDGLGDKARGKFDAARKMAVTVLPAGAVCLRLKPTP